MIRHHFIIYIHNTHVPHMLYIHKTVTPLIILVAENVILNRSEAKRNLMKIHTIHTWRCLKAYIHRISMNHRYFFRYSIYNWSLIIVCLSSSLKNGGSFFLQQYDVQIFFSRSSIHMACVDEMYNRLCLLWCNFPRRFFAKPTEKFGASPIFKSSFI